MGIQIEEHQWTETELHDAWTKAWDTMQAAGLQTVSYETWLEGMIMRLTREKNQLVRMVNDCNKRYGDATGIRVKSLK